MSDLTGKVAVVTGTSRNIGGALACGLADAGATVACNDIVDAIADECANEIIARGGQAFSIPFDVTAAADASAAIDTVLERFGHIDVLINNAVKFDMAGVLDMEVDRFRRQVDIIVGGAFVMTQLIARSMVARSISGSIVNVLSTAAWQGQAGNVGYCTAKSGLINFTRSTAMELAPYGIRVNSLTPTATMPEDPELSDAFRSRIRGLAEAGTIDFVGLNPWHRLPTPTDYVAPLVFLASDDAALITGANLTVDGGALAKYWPQIPPKLRGSGADGDSTPKGPAQGDAT